MTAAGPLTGTLCSVMLGTPTLSTPSKAAMLSMLRWPSQTPGLALAADAAASDSTAAAQIQYKYSCSRLHLKF